MVVVLTILMLAVPMSIMAMGNSEKVVESSIDEDFLKHCTEVRRWIAYQRRSPSRTSRPSG